MADIFISYANEDRESAAQLAQMLETVGWQVWWDRRIPAGRTWRSVLEDALRGMRCMVVLWSKDSVESPWVTEEAEEARRLGKTIVPVLIQRVEPPIGFRAIQAADLANWDGTIDDPAARTFIADLKSILGTSLEKPAQPNDLLVSRKIERRLLESPWLAAHWPKAGLAGVAAVLLIAAWQLWTGLREDEPMPPPVVDGASAKISPAPSINSLTIRSDKKELKPSETAKLAVTASYSDGKQNDVKEGVEWSSSVPGVATISEAGEVRALKAGTTDIIAKVGDVASSRWNLSVKAVEPPPKPVAPIKLVALRISSSNRELFTKQKVSLRVSGRYSDNAERFLSDGFELQLSDHAVASVNADGELVALRPGKIEIVARAGDLRSTPLTLLVKESQKTTQPQTKPGKTYGPNSVNPPAVTEQTKARIAAYINRAESLREQGNYAAALAELEKAKALDGLDAVIRKEIEQTRRACNAERVLGNKPDC
jgi:TIR domain/Bacterial Ig-like domain (group 2)